VTNEYGIFAPIVANAGALMAAAIAIGLAFTRGARWQPPEEELPNSVTRMAGLLCAVVIALLWRLGQERLGAGGLGIVAAAGVGLAMVGFLATTYLNTVFAFPLRTGGRILGGYRLTEEAERIQRTKAMRGITAKRLFETGGEDPDKVWTRSSRALVRVGSAVTYLAFLAGASIGLAAAALLVGMGPDA
jgi:hypothetical protein